jgi:iron complex outermembrane receptor protein
MFRETPLACAIGAALGGMLFSSAALAQQANAGAEKSAQQLERVVVTGSSIKRIAAEGSLPVITIKKADIEKSGATSVRELMAQLPSMQGFTTPSDSVNGGGGGVSTASLRNLGAQYTLVLLNGRRVAPYNTGSTVNLEQLPLSAVERVEILADGASTLYGSDAIAGVVNFITKRNSESGGFDITANEPQHGGGRERRMSLSKGFGDFDSDGYNVRLGLGYEKEDVLMASQRSATRSGVIPFTHKGKDLYLWQLSANSNPPNVEITDSAFETLAFYNPQLLLKGNCGTDPGSIQQGGTCRFDYASTVQLRPESERKNVYASADVKLGDFKAFAEGLFSDSKMTAAYAPPAQPLQMEVGGTLYNRYVAPTLASQGLTPGDVGYVFYYMRLRDAGLRTNEYRTKGKHLVLGVEGQLLGFDGSVSLTHSRNDLTDSFAGGYTSANILNQLIDSGAFDPFTQGSAASKAALAPAVLSGPSSTSKSGLDVYSVKGSRALFELGGGEAYLGVGAEFMKQSYASTPSAIIMGPNALQPGYSDFPVGSDNGVLPFDTTRSSMGAYAELVAPISKELELTGALRADSYDAAKNNRGFDDLGNPTAPTTQGNKASKVTYKLSARLQPMRDLLIRASYGTGFRAPTLGDITNPLQGAGVIGTQRGCPVSAGDPLYVGCRTNPYQYRQMTGGNPFTGEQGLKPENSKQWSVGFRVEPSASFSAGVDLWSVHIDDVITSVPEDTAFDNFSTYRNLFTVTTDPATGAPILTFVTRPINGAAAESKGVDIDMTSRGNTGLGRLTTQATLTYLHSSWYDYGFGGGKESSIGKLGSDDQVAFRTLVRLQATLDSGPFSNTLSFFWKPGYTDQTYTVDDGTIRERNPSNTAAFPAGQPGAFVGISDFKVPEYYTFDWQGKYNFSKDLSLTLGIKNLMDAKPPLSIKTVNGNMLGADPRYHDLMGRTFYAGASYKF